jgi:bifunctional non-homologous end joining protein LigD
VRLVDELVGDPADLLASACARSWEGLVAKRVASSYVSGRSGDWRKLKCSVSQELVIGGWTEPHGTRTGFGALLVGYYEGDRLRYGGKVGSGFSTGTLQTLHGELLRRQRDTSPFFDPVPERTARWAEPDLVANITFTEWTRDGRLRHPRFEGLRPGKEAASAVREHPID